MKFDIQKKPCPEKYIQAAFRRHKKANKGESFDKEIILQEVKEGLLWTYHYHAYHSNFDIPEIKKQYKQPKEIIIADMDKRKWWTWRDGKWGKGKCFSMSRCYYRKKKIQENVIGHVIDKDIYGIHLWDMQDQVTSEQAAVKRKKKMEDKERIMSQVKELPPAFEKWAINQFMDYMVFSIDNRKEGYCSHCREKVPMEKLINGTTVQCPICGRKMEARTGKKMPRIQAVSTVYVQPIKEGMMYRFIQYQKCWDPDGEETVYHREGLRMVQEFGKGNRWFEKRIWDYEMHEYSGWSENKVNGWIKSINSPVAVLLWGGYYETKCLIYRRNLAALHKKSPMAHLEGAKKLIGEVASEQRYKQRLFAYMDIMKACGMYPILESLWKLGFENLVLDIVVGKIRIGRQKENHKALGISKELWRYMLSTTRKMDGEWLNKMKILGKVHGRIQDKDRAAKMMIGSELQTLFIIKKLKLKKTVDYLEGKQSAYMYIDYLQMSERLNLEPILYPRDLEALHDQLVELLQAEENQKKLEKAAKMDEDIKKIYKKIKKRFSYENEKYILRPAKSNVEIVKEGQIQHICVGSGYYTEKMIKNESYILFLRQQSEPDKPYYTIEITPQYDIRQRHGKYNKEFEEVEEIDKFLNQFVEEKTHGEKHYA